MTKFKILTWLAVVALLLALPVAVLAQGDGQPARPAVFAGTAMVDGEKVADGTMVVAMIGDEKVGSAMTMDSMYALTIPQNPMMDYTDKDIMFMIGKLESPETAMWKPDGGGELNLTADMSMMRRGPAMINMGVRGVNTVLVDDNGMTLYAFSQDTQGAGGTAAVSACTSEQCLAAWPLVTTDGDGVAGGGVDQSLLGMAEHANGAMQVTYNGWPLYRFAGDLAAGDSNGQGLGGAWWVVSLSGEAVQGTGMMGMDGKDGAAGAAGRDGADGKDGVDGKDGADGKDGVDGNDGAPGKDGADGQDGAQGPQGEQGPAGDAGPKGDTGPAGTAGAPGGGGALAVVALIIAIVAVVIGGAGIMMGRRSAA